MRAARWLGLGLALLCLCRPAEPWYRQAAGPRHYSVGRASGLLSGLRRSPYARRSDTDGAAEPGPGALLPGSALCVTDVAPAPWSCRVLPGTPGTFQCKADVTVSLDPVECADA
ncbi:neuropeptide B [Pelecanus crispus]|uniref:neuropeptide B n=1 Tax=Pelecanus crispus TaxID=36300 RepID=UPI003F5D0B16